MLHVELHCQEFMDRVPVAQASLHVRLLVTPYYWHSAEENQEPGGPPPLHPHATTDPEFDLAEAFEADLVTDAAGNASVDFHPAAAWQRVAQIRLNDALPRVVRGHLSVTADVPWLQLHVSKRDVVLQEPDETPRMTVIVDPAKLIIGHTTTTSTRLWFQLHGAPKSGFQFVAELAAGGGAPRRETLSFSTDLLKATLAAIAGLQPGTTYAIELFAENPGAGARAVLARGSVRTLLQTPARWDFAFTSCHQPSDLPSLAPWMRRAARPSADLMLMVGDQIYDSGMAETDSDASGWFARYAQRYNRLWVYQPFRDVLRRTPTCMILDDHEVKDDWGVASTEEVGRVRVQAALNAYRRYQDVLNPPGRTPPVWDYGWRSGPIAFYMLDERSHRGSDKTSNILGSQQVARFQAWAASADTRAADVVLIGSGVPLAFLPIQRLLDVLNSGAQIGGAIAGAMLGSIAGPAGAIVGAFLGAIGGGLAEEAVVDAQREPDFHDHWTYGENQTGLTQVLDILFDLANDISGGVAGPRPRAVIVLSGDIHIGGCYLLRSQRRGDGHDHRRNNLIFQFVSSPSSTKVVSNTLLKKLIEPAGSDIDLRRATFLGDNPDVQADNPLDVTRFLLDSQGAHHYAAELLASLWDYNFGSLVIERSGPRAYRFSVSVEGSHDSLTTLFELNLDAPVIRPRDLIGERLSTTGTPVLLRVHEQGSGYGPVTDRLDVEIVVQLDREPGRSFGLRLREDAAFNAHRGMLRLLRQAFNANTPVTIEYDRTGPRNGTIVRVIQPQP